MGGDHVVKKELEKEGPIVSKRMKDIQGGNTIIVKALFMTEWLVAVREDKKVKDKDGERIN